VGKLDPNMTAHLHKVIGALKEQHKDYENRMVGKSCIPLITELDDTLFLAMAQELLHAGIPVWITMPSRFLPLIWIDALVEPHLADRYTNQADFSPPFNMFLTVPSTSLEKYKAYNQFSYKIMGLANPFEADALGLNAPSSMPGPSTSTSTDSSHPLCKSQHGIQCCQSNVLLITTYFSYHYFQILSKSHKPRLLCLFQGATSL